MKRPFNDLYGDFFASSTKKKTTEKKSEPITQPLKQDEMKKMMDDLTSLENEMNQIIASSSKKLDQKIDALSKANGLKEEDFKPGTVVNETYTDLQEVIEKYVLGQNEAIAQLNMAFKRPYYLDLYASVLNTILLCGPRGSGKHSLITQFARALYTHQHTRQANPIWIDAANVQDEATLIQDLYGAMQKERSIIVLENIERCQPAYLNLLQNLCADGILPLKERYTLQNQKLVNAKSMLDAGLVSQIQANQHYFIFLSNESLSKTKQKLGNQFLTVIQDFIETKALTPETCLKLLKKDLAVFEHQLQEKFQTNLHFDKAALNYLVDCYTKENGYHAIKSTLEKLYRELTDYLLAHPQAKLTVTCLNHHLAVDENHQFLKTAERTQELADIQKEMDEIVGLANVKAYIYALKDMIEIRQKRMAQGLKGADISMHMIFTGNPGTGKTTMARLMSRYLKALGILKNGQLVEVTRADLVASYVGQTAPKTKQVIESSLGGVLFIDEAYSLYRGKEDSFGLEAIDMLVKGMEDHRDEFVVVLAGYTKEMAAFLEANSGLKSRFPNTMEFPDYTKEELLAIAISIARAKDYEIEAAAHQKLLTYFDKVQKDNASRSGNGRLARNVVEDAILKQSSRLIKDPDASLTTLLDKDFELS